MRDTVIDPQFGTPLRRRARQALVVKSSRQDAAEPETQKLLRKLRIRQTELERQNAELRLARSGLETAHAAFAELFDFAPVAYFIVDRDCVVREANFAAAALLDIPREKLRRMDFAALLAQGSRRCFAKAITMLQHKGSVHNKQWQVRRGDGRLLPVLVNATMQRDARGEAVSSRWVLTDIGVEQRLADERAAHARHMAEMSHRLIDAQESERRRFSAELNDLTSSNLATIQVGLKSLADDLPRKTCDACAEQFQDIAAHINDAAAAVREICFDLRPPLLDYAGLQSALKAYASKFARQTGMELRVRTEGLKRRPRSQLESALFRVVQEALANCAKHSRARAVELVLSVRKERIALSIADDGVGFDAVERMAGLGLSVMRERIEFVGGRFRLDTRPNGGTRIEVEVEGPDGLYD